jgi:hypothetical protein
MRTLPVILALCVLAPPALADVVILKENDIPLQGRIVAESETTLTFQIRGLGDGAKMEIEKARVRRFWREENSYFEFLQGEKDRIGTLGRIGSPPAPSRATAPPEPAAAPAARIARTTSEIRRALVDKAWNRLRSALPGEAILRVLLFVGSILFLGALLHTGGRVSGLRRLRLPQAALLSLITHLLVVVAIAAPRTVLRPDYLPVLVTAEVLVWLLMVRLLAGAVMTRAFLLFSFCLGSLVLVGGSVFSVLTVL